MAQESTSKGFNNENSHSELLISARVKRKQTWPDESRDKPIKPQKHKNIDSESKKSSSKRIAIIGAGPAGCICAYYLQNNFDVTLFDKSIFLRTLLPTGGGRCNLAHAEYDFRQLATNYPRGEKFLYSIFSKFDTSNTIDFFDEIGVKTYTQNDNRIFPISNSSADVRDKILKSLSKSNFVQERVNKIQPLSNGWKVESNKSIYAYDYIIIAIGGHAGYEILNELDIKIQPPTQALVGLTTKEDFSDISGVSIKDILFTHKGISGPTIYKLSSINARKEFPYKVTLKLASCANLQEELNNNPHKEIKNLLGQIIPKSLAIWILENLSILPESPCHKINGKMRDLIINKLENFEVTITGKVPDGEVVTCGGVDLKEVNGKTLEAKQYPGLYFCGEVLDIDGFCGGFNLQNCWSTGFIVSQSIINK